MQYANAVYGGACMITALPKCLRPLFGHLIAIPAKYHLAACQKILVPVVKERISLYSSNTEKQNIPDDALQWMIERCAKFGCGQLAPEKIAQRLLILNLVSIYTLAYAFTNVIVDLFGNESKDDFIAGLRDECDRVATEQDGLSSVGAINSLYRIDSTIRESMRLSAFGIISLPRIVGAPGGLDIGDGIVVPPGVRLGVPSQAIHRDAANYQDPLQFDAFRFSSRFEHQDQQAYQTAKQKLSVDIDKTFLTYGYGKHACPGRWFASQVMKQALAYVVQNYDVKLAGSMPERQALLNMILPPTSTNISIRRRL
ncbi:hypothetical protein Golomagni_07258 [Golovinomyces magnicellulatus]|nr:hypothetical protein Golomagni_07258 [Golovinomyces magnicellulatus]